MDKRDSDGPPSNGNPRQDRPEPEKDRDVEEALDHGEFARAVSILIGRYAPKLHRRYAWRCGSAIDDLLQNVFLQVWNDLPSFERKGPIGAWVQTIARNRFIDQMRGKKGPPPEPEPALAPPDVIKEMEEWEQVIALCDGIKELMEKGILSKEELRAIEWHYIDGLSFPDMAKRCGENVGTLQMRVTRAMLKVQKRLNDKGRNHG